MTDTFARVHPNIALYTAAAPRTEVRHTQLLTLQSTHHHYPSRMPHIVADSILFTQHHTLPHTTHKSSSAFYPPALRFKAYQEIERTHPPSSLLTLAQTKQVI